MKSSEKADDVLSLPFIGMFQVLIHLAQSTRVDEAVPVEFHVMLLPSFVPRFARYIEATERPVLCVSSQATDEVELLGILRTT